MIKKKGKFWASCLIVGILTCTSAILVMADRSTTDSNLDDPELIPAYGVDGTLGYVKSKDLSGEIPKTPEEALSIQRTQSDGFEIPLYDEDGQTVIGVFKVEPGISVDIP